MGWLIFILFAAMAMAVLWRFADLSHGAWLIVAGVLCVGLIGYGLQASPNLPSAPAVGLQNARSYTPDTEARRDMMGRWGGVSALLDTEDQYILSRDPTSAINEMASLIKLYPEDEDLWVGLGNAFVAKTGGLLTPAAQFCYNKAAELSPQHPAPPYFLALALAQSGRLDEAGQIWTPLLARAPADALWRKDVVDRLAELKKAEAGR